MRKIKIEVIIGLIILMLVGYNTIAQASQAPEITTQVNGITVKTDINSIIDSTGEVLVPVRAIAEAMGLQVEWRPTAGFQGIAVIGDADKKILLEVGKTTYFIHQGEQKETRYFDTLTINQDGRILAPAKVFEHFNKDVYYAKDAKHLFISQPGILQAYGEDISKDFLPMIFCRNQGGLYNLPVQNITDLKIATIPEEPAFISLTFDLSKNKDSIAEQINLAETILDGNARVADIKAELERAVDNPNFTSSEIYIGNAGQANIIRNNDVLRLQVLNAQ